MKPKYDFTAYIPTPWWFRIALSKSQSRLHGLPDRVSASSPGSHSDFRPDRFLSCSCSNTPWFILTHAVFLHSYAPLHESYIDSHTEADTHAFTLVHSHTYAHVLAERVWYQHMFCDPSSTEGAFLFYNSFQDEISRLQHLSIVVILHLLL